MPTLKSTTTQEPISSWARHTMQILQQHRNMALSVNIQAAQSHTKPIDPSQNSLLDTPLHSTEKKSSSTHQNTDTASLNSEPRQAKHPAPPPGRNLHNKKEPQATRIEKGHPNHSNLNKMKRQRNTQQVNEHEKSPPSQTKEEEIGNLPEKNLEW